MALSMLALLAAIACTPRGVGSVAPVGAFTFERAQPELFSSPGAQPNAWADYDGDGDLDLFVGFRNARNRLYRNDAGVFTNVAPEAGLDEPMETRAAAWGDFDGDGDPDLYIGFPAGAASPNKLYRNDRGKFVDVADQLGAALTGTTRQPVWVDYDGDGDLDLFVAFRDKPNTLLRNDGARFTDVTQESGIGDTRKTVGAAWFDMDMDGDLDVFVANQDGDTDALYRNDGGHFIDVAPQLGMHNPGRRSDIGGVGVAVSDYDNDGDLDVHVAAYGPDLLWRNDGTGHFANVAPGTPLAADEHQVTAVWGDLDNDGWPDLYLAAFLGTEPETRDRLFHNVRGSFMEETPALILEKGASHGVAAADFDRDGDLDLALANNHPLGTHALMRNLLAPEAAIRSLQVTVVDSLGRASLPGAEVRLFESASGRVLGTRLVDSGGGYCSQGVVPVHFGLAVGVRRVDVEVTVPLGGRRTVTVVRNVDPTAWRGHAMVIRARR